MTGPLDDLPRVDRRQARWSPRSLREAAERLVRAAVSPMADPIAMDVSLGDPEILDRAAGIARPCVVIQLAWPRRNTRLGIGLETPVAHAIVDALLGFRRVEGQERLQVTPVEWGLLTFVASRALGHLAETPGLVGSWDLVLDRVSPEPFRIEGLGPVATIRFPVTIGETSASARLWVPEALWESLQPAPSPPTTAASLPDAASDWRAEAGSVLLPRGVGRLRAGSVLPILGTRLAGSPSNLSGRIDLVARAVDLVFRMDAEPVGEAGAAVLVHPPIRREPQTREPHVMSSAAPAPSPGAQSSELPVTLTVELGRLSLPLSRLSSLREGDTLELGRTSREPVELTSGGRLIARGELVQIDTELGVRLTSVFL